MGGGQGARGSLFFKFFGVGRCGGGESNPWGRSRIFWLMILNHLAQCHTFWLTVTRQWGRAYGGGGGAVHRLG